MRRTLRSSAEVFHYWAHQVQSEGKAGNVFFRDSTVYSYGDHFPIATLYAQDGKPAVGRGAPVAFALVNSGRYSVTTSGHQSAARSAISHVRQIEVPYPMSGTRYGANDHPRNMDYFREAIPAALLKAKRARSDWARDMHHERAVTLARNMRDYALLFSLKGEPALAPEQFETLLAWAEQQDKQRKERAKREAEEQRKSAAERIAEWKQGVGVSLPWALREAFLRVAGDEIETSKGARIPTDHARKVWPILKRLREKGATYQRNGHTIHLGVYALDKVDAQGNVTAGCHFIPWSEIADVARALGLS